MYGKSPRQGLFAAATALAFAAAALAQHEPQPTPPPKPTAEQKRGSQEAPTHAPQPEAPPALVLQWLRDYHAAWAAAASTGKTPPPAPPRPAGAGRHVCAVIVCADADVEVAPMLGLDRKDVLVLALPGPFVSPEAVALLEHAVTEERLSLVVVLSHADCTTAELSATEGPRKTLADRVARMRARAVQVRRAFAQVLARAEAEQVVAASKVMQEAVAADRLRVVAAELEDAVPRITWHASRADAMPMPPIR